MARPSGPGVGVTCGDIEGFAERPGGPDAVQRSAERYLRFLDG